MSHERMVIVQPVIQEFLSEEAFDELLERHLREREKVGENEFVSMCSVSTDTDICIVFSDAPASVVVVALMSKVEELAEAVKNLVIGRVIQ